jgi:hypothetical protein
MSDHQSASFRLYHRIIEMLKNAEEGDLWRHDGPSWKDVTQRVPLIQLLRYQHGS